MNTEDKIYQKIQQASEKMPNDSFPGMDKVWSRVEEKLDTNVLKKENNRWKKFSVAAAVIIVGTLVYQFSQPENIITTNETVVTVDTLQPVLTEPEDAIVTNEKIEIVEEKEIILQKAIEKPKLVMAEEVIVKNDTYFDDEPVIKNDEVLSEVITQGYKVNKNLSESARIINKDKINYTPVTNAKRSELQSNFAASSTEHIDKKLPPLVIINGQKSKVSDLKNIPKEDLEAVIVLNDPIYIINGMMYTEEELFGPNPTSPYAPLHKQDIISTTILQEEDALIAYGEKGKKGVVIIKTKEGKPKK
jgi:hypothetical protein